MNILDLLKKQDEAISHAASEANAAEIKAGEAAQAAAEMRKILDELRAERATLEEVGRRYGQLDDLPAAAEIKSLTDYGLEDRSEWQGLTRLDAVERVVRESHEPIHIRAIVDTLHANGRTADTYPLVSASLANLRQRRESVKPAGRGHWMAALGKPRTVDEAAHALIGISSADSGVGQD
jgi:hypothetical protein